MTYWDKSERLANLCKQVGATEYISGPTAKSYIDADVFKSLKSNLHGLITVVQPIHSCGETFPLCERS